ncbi:hypothetical protein LINGRAHAP2_LOCUS19417 [Linum grandiflorum]
MLERIGDIDTSSMAHKPSRGEGDSMADADDFHIVSPGEPVQIPVYLLPIRSVPCCRTWWHVWNWSSRCWSRVLALWLWTPDEPPSRSRCWSRVLAL